MVDPKLMGRGSALAALRIRLRAAISKSSARVSCRSSSKNSSAKRTDTFEWKPLDRKQRLPSDKVDGKFRLV